MFPIFLVSTRAPRFWPRSIILPNLLWTETCCFNMSCFDTSNPNCTTKVGYTSHQYMWTLFPWNFIESQLDTIKAPLVIGFIFPLNLHRIPSQASLSIAGLSGFPAGFLPSRCESRVGGLGGKGPMARSRDLNHKLWFMEVEKLQLFSLLCMFMS